jgi:hypothetical protein
MDVLSLLCSAAKALADAVKKYQGNEVNLKQLAKLVNSTVQLARSANINNIPEAADVIHGLIESINKGCDIVAKLNKKGTLWRVIHIHDVEENIGVVVTGIRDSLLALTCANFHLSHQHLQALNRVSCDLEVFWGNQQQAIAQLVQIQQGLDLLGAGSAARHEKTMEIMQAMLDKLDLAPQQLAAEVQRYTSSSEGEDGSDGGSEGRAAAGAVSSEQQVRSAVPASACTHLVMR